MHRRLAAWALALALVLVTRAAPARAAEVQVNPVVVSLSQATRSAIVAVRNEGTETARFELQARSWAQGPDGEMLLEPTGEIAVYPPVLTLAPGEERNVRIGAVTPFGPVERTYRVFLQELAPPEKPEGAAQVRVLTRIGLPVFLSPARPVERTAMQELQARGGKVSFRLVNEGNVHVRPQAVTLAGKGADGKVLFELELPAWYVLAGGRRDYEVAIPEDACPALRAVEATVTLPRDAPVRARLERPGLCAP